MTLDMVGKWLVDVDYRCGSKSEFLFELQMWLCASSGKHQVDQAVIIYESRVEDQRGARSSSTSACFGIISVKSLVTSTLTSTLRGLPVHAHGLSGDLIGVASLSRNNQYDRGRRRTTPMAPLDSLGCWFEAQFEGGPCSLQRGE